MRIPYFRVDTADEGLVSSASCVRFRAQEGVGQQMSMRIRPNEVLRPAAGSAGFLGRSVPIAG